MSQRQLFLLQILVGINPGGTFSHKILSYLDGSITADPLAVNVGDEVGFLVQVVQPTGYLQYPYKIEFSDESFFGTTTLNVPNGGTSPFLHVLSLDTKVKYTIFVTGLGKILDPEIQSGGDGVSGALGISNKVIFTWDVAGKTATYMLNGAAVPYSTQLQPSKYSVEFQAINTPGMVQDFSVTFPPDLNQPTHWASPFSANLGSFVAPATSPTDIGAQTVTDPVDKGSMFPFTASITVSTFTGSVVINLPGNISPYIQL